MRRTAQALFYVRAGANCHPTWSMPPPKFWLKQQYTVLKPTIRCSLAFHIRQNAFPARAPLGEITVPPPHTPPQSELFVPRFSGFWHSPLGTFGASISGRGTLPPPKYFPLEPPLQRRTILLLLHQNALCWLWQPSVPNYKRNIAEKNSKILNFCTVLLILRKTANPTHGSQFCTKFCTRRIAEFWHYPKYLYVCIQK